MSMAGVSDVDSEVQVLDIYSCFPSAVQVLCRELRESIDHSPQRPLTVTGGLSFHGGPGILRVPRDCRCSRKDAHHAVLHWPHLRQWRGTQCARCRHIQGALCMQLVHAAAASCKSGPPANPCVYSWNGIPWRPPRTASPKWRPTASSSIMPGNLREPSSSGRLPMQPMRAFSRDATHRF